MAKLTREGNFLCWESTPEEYEREMYAKEHFLENIPPLEQMLRKIRESEEHDFSEKGEPSLSKERLDWQKDELKQIDCLEEILKKKADNRAEFSESEKISEEDLYENCPKEYKETNKIMIEYMKKYGLL